MKKFCTHLKCGTKSIYLKEVAQATTISLLLPEYTFCWDYPIETECLLLLNTSIIPQHFSDKPERWDWVKEIPELEGMPKTNYYWNKLLGRSVKEIVI